MHILVDNYQDLSVPQKVGILSASETVFKLEGIKSVLLLYLNVSLLFCVTEK